MKVHCSERDIDSPANVAGEIQKLSGIMLQSGDGEKKGKISLSLSFQCINHSINFDATPNISESKN